MDGGSRRVGGGIRLTLRGNGGKLPGREVSFSVAEGPLEVKVKRKLGATFVWLVLGLAWPSFALEPIDGPRQVAPGVFRVSGLEGGVVSFLVTDDGVAVIDSGISPAEGRKILAQVAMVTEKPVRYLIYTHSHWDHTLGGEEFPPAVRVVAQQNLRGQFDKFLRNELPGFHQQRLERQLLLLRGRRDGKAADDPERVSLEREISQVERALADLQPPRGRLPDITFSHHLTLFLGDERLEIDFSGPTHLDDAVTVWLPRQKVLVTGDLVFARRLPYLDIDHGCDTANWIRVLEGLLRLAPAVVVPGHGENGGSELLIQQREYLEQLRAAVTLGIGAGKTLEQLQKEIDLPLIRDWPRTEAQPRNIAAVYRELSQTKPADAR